MGPHRHVTGSDDDQRSRAHRQAQQLRVADAVRGAAEEVCSGQGDHQRQAGGQSQGVEAPEHVKRCGTEQEREDGDGELDEDLTHPQSVDRYHVEGIGDGDDHQGRGDRIDEEPGYHPPDEWMVLL